jgi:hypothetical protein
MVLALEALTYVRFGRRVDRFGATIVAFLGEDNLKTKLVRGELGWKCDALS